MGETPPGDSPVALCHTRQEALEVKARLASWLAPRGLAFNEDKTRVVTLDEGFDFLGFNVRRYGTKRCCRCCGSCELSFFAVAGACAGDDPRGA